MKPICLMLLAPLGLGLATIQAQTQTYAQAWPTRPIHAIVAAGAGSTIDIIPRIAFEQLSTELDQPIVVENRAGAGGTIASQFVANAAPDGYTLLVNSAAQTIAPALYSKLTYDTAHDFAGVLPLGILPQALVVAPGAGFKTVGDLVAAASAKPGGLTYASVGIGSATQMAAERFLVSAGIKAVHVPFKGGAEAMAEVMSGRVDFFFGPVGLILPLVRDGKLTALVVNGAKRSPALPDVPTTREAGYADADYPFWFGVFAPAKTPRDIIEKLNREARKVLDAPEVREKLTALGVDPMIMSPAEFDSYIRSDLVASAALVKSAGIKPE
jgi:tripartite-type tricarboxylate transporter receptor subunit TctC